MTPERKKKTVVPWHVVRRQVDAVVEACRVDERRIDAGAAEAKRALGIHTDKQVAQMCADAGGHRYRTPASSCTTEGYHECEVCGIERSKGFVCSDPEWIRLTAEDDYVMVHVGIREISVLTIDVKVPYNAGRDEVLQIAADARDSGAAESSVYSHTMSSEHTTIQLEGGRDWPS